jgi:hypothetical protein
MKKRERDIIDQLNELPLVGDGGKAIYGPDILIYRCRLCGRKFELGVPSGEYMRNSILANHVCKDGRFGVGDILGGYALPRHVPGEGKDKK